jgi:flagellin-like hook-associated protein FlgL
MRNANDAISLLQTAARASWTPTSPRKPHAHSRVQSLQQAGMAMVAQANLMPRGVLALLR